MFKVNNKDTRTYFTPCSSVSIVNFQHVNDGLDESNWFTSIPYKNNEKWKFQALLVFGTPR